MWLGFKKFKNLINPDPDVIYTSLKKHNHVQLGARTNKFVRPSKVMHLGWSGGWLFQTLVLAYIGDAGIVVMKEIWQTVPSYEQCSALNTAITTHLFVFETTRRSLNFPTGLNGGITWASAIQLTYIMWSSAAQK